MTEQEIIEGNSLIAEFLGWPSDKVYVYKVPNRYPFTDDINDEYGWTEWAAQDISFDVDWNYLMPVIEKMAKMKLKYINADEEYSPYPNTFGMVDEEGNYMVRIFCSQLFHAKTLIEAAWLAVVDFIKWHHNQTNNQPS